MSTETAEFTENREHSFAADVNEVLGLVINSLYSNKEIFLRELLSNASDALDKQRFAMVTRPDADKSEELRIRIIPDETAGTITIEDNGIGMAAEELVKNLGTVAHSGSKEFLAQLKAQKEQSDVDLIGQFGVGFYSAYLVADRVEVISRSADSDRAHRWQSDAKSTFTVGPAERAGRGTTVILHLEDENKELTGEWRIRELVRRYSDYIGHPIELKVKKGEGAEAREEFEVINQARALWQRPAKEITDEQYEEFYKHLTHDWEGPLCRKHFHIEGAMLFTGLLFVPKRPPFGLFSMDAKHGVRLHVKRVFIMDDCEELLPRWLRFVRGVIDSDDLPLNVSREILQDSHVVRTIRKQVVKHSLDMLDNLAKDDSESYASLWQNFGAVLKEGLHYDPEYKDRLAGLVRFSSSVESGLVSLADYIERMPEEQPAIYYAIGTSRDVVEASPHIEAIKNKGYEVLFMTDPIDQWAVAGLGEYKDKKLVSAMTADLGLSGDDDDKAGNKSSDKAEGDKENDSSGHAELDPLLLFMRSALQEKVDKVRVSERLTDSPVCLVIPEGGMQPHIERMLRAQNADMPATKRILEVNAKHPLIGDLRQLHSRDSESSDLKEWVEVLYEQALLAEGSPVDNPVLMASRLTKLLRTAAAQAAQPES
ncbi:MAG: molecular chaperone HtpG [Proteobacteria bacterium]|nr:molecular chaperone HtpG [Pseudomonadota bacterium]